jgi:hypothetical protein
MPGSGSVVLSLQRSTKGLVWSGLVRVWGFPSAYNHFLYYSAVSFEKGKEAQRWVKRYTQKTHKRSEERISCFKKRLRAGLLCAGADCRGSGGAGGVKCGQEVGGEAQVCGALPGGELCERLPL